MQLIWDLLTTIRRNRDLAIVRELLIYMILDLYNYKHNLSNGKFRIQSLLINKSLS